MLSVFVFVSPGRVCSFVFLFVHFVLCLFICRFIGRAISEGLTREGPWGREEEAGRIKVEKESEMHQRDIAGLGVVCWSMRNPDACVDIYRVHDVQVFTLYCIY